jgi:IMP cyclohydrolase
MKHKHTEEIELYVGRLLLVGAAKCGGMVAAYRLASRSFPNRKIQFNPETKTAHVVPLPVHGKETIKNPLLDYTCLQVFNNAAVLVANGSHLDMIYSKIRLGLAPIESMRRVLQALGTEDDAYKTPRIAGFVSPKKLVIGIVSEEELVIRVFPFKPGFACYVSTYGRTQPMENVSNDFDVKSAEEASETVHGGSGFRHFTHAINTVAAFIKNHVVEVSIYPKV